MKRDYTQQEKSFLPIQELINIILVIHYNVSLLNSEQLF